MSVIFILIAGYVIQCIGARWCEHYSQAGFNYLLLGGSVELMFEIVGLIKIYRRKSDKIVQDRTDLELKDED